MFVIQPNTTDQFSSLTVIRLQRSLRAEEERSGFHMRNQNVSPLYDGSLFAVTFPDHLLTGIGNNFISLFSKELVTEERRCSVEMKVFHSTSINGIDAGNIFKWDKIIGKCRG